MAVSRNLVSGVLPRPSIRLAPHIVLRSNLPLFLDADESESREFQKAAVEQALK